MRPPEGREGGRGASGEAGPSGDACYRKGVELLARRAHFAAELSRKLAARGFAAADIDDSVGRLTAQGYLDDVATARAFVSERRRRSGWGATRLRAELARRGVSGAALAVALEELSGEEEEELARRAAERWRRRGGEDPAALARHLERKGFAPHVILRLVRESGGEG